MHNAAFAALGLDMVYVALPVSGAHLGDAVRGLSAMGFRGVNVTMPHKAAVIPFLNEVDEQARLADAVNTIVFESGSSAGCNTDIGGFSRALRECARYVEWTGAFSGRGRVFAHVERAGGE